MNEMQKPSRGRRNFPAVYERLIPIALGVIAVAMLIAVSFAVAVALRLLPGINP